MIDSGARSSIRKNKISKHELSILFVLDVLLERNGVGSFYRDLSDYLKDHFKQVAFIGPLNKKNKDKYTLFSISMPGDPTQRLYFPRIFKLSNAISEIDPDIIVLPTPGLYGIVALKKVLKLKTMVCPVLHNDYDNMAKIYWSGFRGKFIAWLGKCVNRMFFKSGSISLVINNL